MEAPYILISTISPKNGKKIDAFDKHSKYIVKVLAPADFSETLFEYAEYFFEAAYKITEFILYAEHPDIGKLDTYFFSIVFLYRHCMELGLKAVGFQSIQDIDGRKSFVKDTRHNLSVILSIIEEKASSTRPEEEMEWLREYFSDLSQRDRESDSFRYPFHIVWEPGDWECEGKFVIKKIFDEQTYIDLVKFANKFEAAYEIIRKWYKKEAESAVEWKAVNPVFIETGGYYYAQSVVGYKYNRADFYPYTKAYLETANYLKWYMKNETDSDNSDYNERLFLPMCYLYRNCVELSLKTIWFEEIGEDFQTKCKLMLDNKHSIAGMWKKIKPYVLEYTKGTDEPEYIEVIEDYCMQIHTIDGDANKFRYPMSNSMQEYFSHNKRFDFMETGDFFEALNNILDGIDGELNHMNEVTMTLEEAQLSEPFGGYMLSEAPSGFTVETIRRYQDETANYLSGLWTKGEGSFDEISWRVSSYDDTMENRVTSVDDTQNYDLSLYPFPLADSVPEELFEVVDHPIFNIDELTLEAVSRRAYTINESSDTDAIRMTFGVRYGDIVVDVTTKGVSPEWIYEQLIELKDVGSNTQDMAAKRAAQNVIVDETMTLEEAQLSEPFGGYMLSEAPSGFTSDIIRRYQDETVNYLSGFWTKGEDSFDEISWRVSSYDATMENRVTSVDDTKNYDLSLYSFPLADSVPEELFEIVDHPIFNMDELTLEAINRRAYSINESNDTSAIRMTFGVRYGDVVVEVTTKGVSAQWIYDQLVNVYHDKSCINFRSSN